LGNHTHSYLALSGGTLTGKLTTVASAAGNAGISLPHGSAPTSPSNGDMWTTTAGVYARINGVTVGPFEAAAGSYQPASADLTAIDNLAGTSGFLKKTATDTWTLDTNTYLTANQSITLSGVVTGSGTTAITTSFASNPTFTGSVSATDGFKTTTYVSNARNPIWRFGNSDGYGISYFQGSSSVGGNDTIGFHFGTATAAASLLQLNRTSIATTGNVGINVTPSAALHVVTTSSSNIGMLLLGASGQSANLQEWRNYSNTVLASVDAVGNFVAVTKSFDIEHPSDPDKRLRYGSLEGPEYGVYVRGRSQSNTIHLPDYWVDLVDEDSITVQLTPMGRHQELYVDSIANNSIIVAGVTGEYFYFIQAERKDIDKLEVEYGS